MVKAKRIPSNDLMFCWKCGEKIGPDSEFCKHCGAPKDPEKSPISSDPGTAEGRPRKSRRGRTVVKVFLIVILIIIAAVAIYFFINYEDVDEHEYYSYNPSTIPTTLTIDIDMHQGGMEILFTSDPNEPIVYIDYHKRWQGVVVRQPSFSTSSNNVTFKSSDVMGEANSEVTMILRDNITYSVNAKISDGGMSLSSNGISGLTFNSITMDSYNGASNIDLSSATISGKLKIKSENGGANARLTNCVIGDIRGDSKSGGLSISLIGSSVHSASTWDIDSEEGGANLDIEQTDPLGADVSVDGDATDGGLSVKFKYNTSAVRVKFSCKAGGDVDLRSDSGFNSPVGGTMESLNFGNTTLDQFLFDLHAHDDYDDVTVTANIYNDE